MEVLTLSKDDAVNILYDGNEKFEIVEDTIRDNRRWSIDHRLVIKRKEDGKLFIGGYSVGATEVQDEGPWEYTDPVFKEAVAVKKTVTVYEEAVDEQ